MKLPLRYNLRSLLQRKARSALTAGGVAAVVFISIMMIGLSRGLMLSTLGNASPNNVIVLSKGAEAMEFSAIDPSDFHRLKSSEYIRASEGEPLASPEAYISTFVQFENIPGEKRGVVRGVWPVAFKVHDPVRIVAGSEPKRGFEVAVGKLAATKLGVSSDTLAIGKWIDFEGQRWKVVGIFEAPETTLESEIWCYLDDLLAASKRIDYSAVELMAKNLSARDQLLFDLETRTDIRVEAKSEEAYYTALAEALKPVQAVSIAMTVILVLGGVMVGMNTMFTSILGRTREMGVLLVLGFKRNAVLASFVLESMLLCFCGGLVGAGLGLLLNGLPMRIPMGAFRFAIDLQVVGIGLCLAVVVGICGAVVPVMRVARLETVQALRAE